MARGSRIGYKLEQAIEAIFANKTLEDAAKAIGISVSTLKRWKSVKISRSHFVKHGEILWKQPMLVSNKTPEDLLRWR